MWIKSAQSLTMLKLLMLSYFLICDVALSIILMIENCVLRLKFKKWIVRLMLSENLN